MYKNRQKDEDRRSVKNKVNVVLSVPKPSIKFSTSIKHVSYCLDELNISRDVVEGKPCTCSSHIRQYLFVEHYDLFIIFLAFSKYIKVHVSCLTPGMERIVV